MLNYIAKNLMLNYLIIVCHLKEPCPLPCMVLELLWRFIVFLTWF